VEPPTPLRPSRFTTCTPRCPSANAHEVRKAYWEALNEAINDRDAKQRLQALVDQLDKSGYTAAARCLADDLDALVVHPRYPTRPPMAQHQAARALARRGQAPHQGDRPLPGEDSWLTLVWAVLDFVITHAANGMRFTQLHRQHLNRIRYQDDDQTIPEEVTAA
jgi:hypothetical protein